MEDRPLLTGAARFVADLPAADALDVVFVRSFVAHGVLRGVDTDAAAAAPGIARVITAADVRDLGPIPLPPRFRIPDGVDRPLLADGRVRFAGEPVAAIVAGTAAQALDAAELVARRRRPAARGRRPGASSRGPARSSCSPGIRNVIAEATFGADVEAAFRSAPVTVELDLVHRRLTPAPIETRRILVEPDGDRLTVWCSHQSPHRLRDGDRGRARHRSGRRPRDRPERRWRLRRQEPDVAGIRRGRPPGSDARPTGPMGRGAFRVVRRLLARPGPAPRRPARRRARRHDRRPRRHDRGRSGRLPPHRGAARIEHRMGDVGALPHPGAVGRRAGHRHEHHAGRGGARRGTPRGGVLAGAGGRRAREGDRRRSCRRPAAEPHPARRVPLPLPDGRDVRQR